MTTLTKDDIPGADDMLEELRVIFGGLPAFEDPTPVSAAEYCACRKRADETVELMRSTANDDELIQLLQTKTTEPLVLEGGTTRPMTENLKLWQLEFQNQRMFFRNRVESEPLCEQWVTEWYHDGVPMTLYRLMLCLEVKGGTVTLN